MSEKIKLDDKIVKEHISDWSYEIKDDLGNKVEESIYRAKKHLLKTKGGWD